MTRTRARIKTHWMVEVMADHGWTLENFTHESPSSDIWAAARWVSGLELEDITKKVAVHFKLEVADLAGADRRILKLVPEKLARKYLVFPVRQDNHYLYVATSEPDNIEAEQAIAFASSRSTVFMLAAPQAIHDAIDTAFSPVSLLTVPAPLFDRRQSAAASDQIHSPEAQPGALRLHTPLVLQLAGLQPIPETKGIESSPGEETRLTLKDSASSQTHVLIVDDDPITRLVARSILTKQGYRVSEATDGIAALENVSTGSPLTLIVLDLNMPRLGGREFLTKLKGSVATSRIPVIVLTGSLDESAEANLLEDGADDYIRKPLDPVRFTARVKAVLRRLNS